jgi:hypothetical protein
MDTRVLIVDARPDSGGDEQLAQQAAAWLVAGNENPRMRPRGAAGAQSRSRTGAVGETDT